MKEQQKVIWGWAPKTWMRNTFTKYGLNHQQWRALWEGQGGRCAGCKEEFAHPLDKDPQRFGLRPETDHKHTEGEQCKAENVRGLLCRRCNDFLGKIQDNPEALANLLAYLKLHGDL